LHAETQPRSKARVAATLHSRSRFAEQIRIARVRLADTILLIVAFATVVAGELKSDVVVISPLARVVCAALVTLSPMSASAAETAIEREAIAIHQDLDVLCRGGSGDADEACAIRLHAEKLLGLLAIATARRPTLDWVVADERLRSGTRQRQLRPSALEADGFAMGGLDETHSELYCALIILHHNDPRIRPDCRT